MKQAIEQFLQCKNIAIIGMSSKGTKFGNLAYKELFKKDLRRTVLRNLKKVSQKTLKLINHSVIAVII